LSGTTFDPFLSLWDLEPDGTPIETHSSWLLPVRRSRSLAMLKIMKHASDEYNAAALLRYFNGNGAVRLYESQDRALLLERAGGPRSLMTMAVTGGDTQAAEVLANTVRELHAPREARMQAGLTPLRRWFSSLYDHEHAATILKRCADVSRTLLGSENDVVPLHGDLHHDNVLDGGDRGWLAIDPKALIGERTYEVANLLGNPWPHADIVHRPARMRRRLGLDPQRVLAFALAHAGLAASWSMEDGRDPTYRLRCAEVLQATIEG
jgi:streptomycin 6-kinase